METRAIHLGGPLSCPRPDTMILALLPEHPLHAPDGITDQPGVSVLWACRSSWRHGGNYGIMLGSTMGAEVSEQTTLFRDIFLHLYRTAPFDVP
jgi:hypothetical protein